MSRRPGDESSPSNPPPAGKLQSFDRIRECFEQVLAASTADETELVWLERRYGGAAHGDGAPPGFFESPRLSVLVRVVERGRVGWYRTDTADAILLESGIRQALSIAKMHDPIGSKKPLLPTDRERLRLPPKIYDREIGGLDPAILAARLAELCENEEGAVASWSEMRLAVYNNHGLRRQATTTSVGLEVSTSRRPGAGWAASAARTLHQVDGQEILGRARRTAAPEGAIGALPTMPVPVLLSPEAAIELLDALNAHAFSGRAFLEGTSFLSNHRNVQVFDRTVHLRDDGTNLSGLPFPFDFEGSPKRPFDLIVEGTPSTPALDQAQGAMAGLEPTAQAIGGQDALFGNLFLLPGGMSEADLLGAADGGLRIARLEHVECYEPRQLRIRAVARGVRRIENGELGEALPDCLWETSLLRALARLRGIGTQPVSRIVSTTPFGAITAPAIVLEEGDGLSLLNG